MTFMQTAWIFLAIKDGMEVGRIKVFDVKDKERSARRYFRKRGIVFDKVEFFREVK